MDISSNYSPNFGAKFIKNASLLKQIENCKSYREEIVSCIKIDTQNESDIKALENIANYWIDSHFATDIYYAAKEIQNGNKYYNNNKIFAITKQKENFENLNPDNILGLVHVSPAGDNSLFIERIEADPDIIFKQNREYKGIGTALLNHLKTITNKITCNPSNTKTVKKFYYKNGFVEYPSNPNTFTWYNA